VAKSTTGNLEGENEAPGYKIKIEILLRIIFKNVIQERTNHYNCPLKYIICKSFAFIDDQHIRALGLEFKPQLELSVGRKKVRL
jgi:hypothetical protein